MNKIKCFIFDQDGTFYPEKSKFTHELRKKTKEWIMKRLFLGKKDIDSLYKKLPKKYPNALEGFISLGLTIDDYHHNVFDIVNPAKYLQKDNKLISVLRKLKGKKFVVTFSSKNYSMALQNSLGIKNLIKKTYYSIDFLPETSKLFIYDFIRKENKLEKEEVLVIGNNLDVDIVPALNEGYGVVLIGKPVRNIKVKSIKNIYNLLYIT